MPRSEIAARHHRPLIEILDSRILLAVDITSFSVAAGTVTFSGDQNATTADTLLLSEVAVGIDGGGMEIRLSHDLAGNGGSGDYEDSTDVDPTSGVANIVIGSGSAPLITVDLATDDDTLTLDGTWTFGHEVTYDAGAGANTLATSDGTNSWTLTGTRAGNINGPTALAFTSVDTLQGGDGTDTLIGEDVASTWALADSLTYDDGSASVSLLGFEVLQGGSDIDTFDITGNDFLATATGTLRGGAADDAFNFNYNITADFPAFLDGSIDGEGGSDTLNYSSHGAPITVVLAGTSDINGFSGGESSSISGTFAGIDVMTGSIGSVLEGENVDSTWTLDGTPTYDDGSNTLEFSAFETLQGGSAIDTFTISASTIANLQGGAGADSFAFADGITLTGIAAGQGDSDTLDLSAYTTNVTIILTSSDLDGFSGTGTATSGFSGIDTITAGSGTNNTITGENIASTWDLDGTPTYDDGTSTLSLDTFQTFQGGSAIDTFNISASTTATLLGGDGLDAFNITTNGVTLTGSIDGEAASGTLSYAGVTSAVAVALASSSGTGFNGAATSLSGGFSNIANVQGGDGSSDTITGENLDSTWTLDGTPTYDDGSNTLEFSAFETLQGGSAIDTFTISASITASLKGGGGLDAFNITTNGVTLTGSIDGEGASSTLSYAGVTSAVAVTLTGSNATTGFGGTATSISAGFSNVGTITGGSSSTDTLTGRNLESTWTLNTTKAYSDGTASLPFASFEVLQGGSGADTFAILANTTATLNGGDDADTFDFQADGVFLSGKIDGQDGTDTLTYSGYTSAVTVNLAAASATGTTGMLRIEFLVGNSSSTTLVGANNANLWSITGTDEGTVDNLILSSSFSFSQVRNLTGGGQLDTFMFSAGASVTGIINGGSGTDTLNFAGYTNALTATISVNNGGSITSPGVSFSFSGMENLTGGSGNDTFSLGSGRILSGTINAGGGTDTLSYASYTTSVRVDLSNGAALGIKGGASNGVLNFENVTGGSGNDILIGGSGANGLTGNGGNDILIGNGGDDTISGNAGTDILIGGTGADALTGGDGDDLLIAGGTDYDSNIGALNAIMAEWSRTDANYATRVSHLNGSVAGGRNGSFFLTDNTVAHDSAIDQLTGGNGLDWFFLTLAQDSITDLDTGGTEEVDDDNLVS